MKSILGTKVGMTQLFAKNGEAIAATLIHVIPNVVTDIKNIQKDGYNALQVGYEEIKAKSANKPKLGQFKKNKIKPTRFIKELKGMTDYKIGDLIKCDIFEKGEYVDIQGISKGHGFTGSIKRHNFGIGPMGHGAGYPHRYVGSISGGRGGSQAQRVFKGTELPGHYGHETVTIQNLVILSIDPINNIIIVKGAIPGPDKSLVHVKLSKKKHNVKNVIDLVIDAKPQPQVENKPAEVVNEPAVEVQPEAKKEGE